MQVLPCLFSLLSVLLLRAIYTDTCPSLDPGPQSVLQDVWELLKPTKAGIPLQLSILHNCFLQRFPFFHSLQKSTWWRIESCLSYQYPLPLSFIPACVYRGRDDRCLLCRKTTGFEACRQQDITSLHTPHSWPHRTQHGWPDTCYLRNLTTPSRAFLENDLSALFYTGFITKTGV